MNVKHWQHPAEMSIRVMEENDERNPIQIYTDGSKTEKGVCLGVAIFESGQYIKSLQSRLNNRCTNNQAEQLVILMALKYIENIQTTDRIAAIYTDGQITLDKLQNSNIHTYLIEEMRRKLREMKETRWKITLCWVKAHSGIRGNELADTLSKKAVTSENITESYKSPKKRSVERTRRGKRGKWQREWTRTIKGRTTKEFFPDVAERLKMKISLSQNLTTIVTWHSKTRAYLHQFKIIEEPTCPCGKGDQTTDHLIFECELLTEEGDRLKSTVVQTNKWPTTEQDLIKRHYKKFTKFINEIYFDELNAE
jgi:ribonuclease HI